MRYLPLLVLAILLGLGGCSGQAGSGSSPGGTTATPTGDVAFTIAWPARSRAIPLAANSIAVTLYRTADSPLLTRIQGRGTAVTDEVRMPAIPVGAYTFDALAYSGFKGDGVAVGVGRGTLTVTVGQTTILPISLDTTVTTLTLTAPPTQYIGATYPLVWNATDAQGQTVVVNPKDLTWHTNDDHVAAVSTLGVLTAVGAGGTFVSVSLPGVTAVSVPVHVASGILLGVTPTVVTLRPGDAASFTATVTGAGVHTVHWAVREGAGGGIDAAGRYTAPVLTGDYHVVATSDADATVTASALVHVVDPGTVALWTVLVYMDADNNLEDYAVGTPAPFFTGDFAKIASVGSSPLVRVLVQLDRAQGSTWSDTRRFEVQQGVALDATPRVDNPPLGELNMGDPQTLSDFIAWGQQYAPAQHYLVVLWDHGSGWRQRTRRPAVRGICYDDTNGGADISTPGLAQALAGHQPIDILLTDACMMQMAEVGYEIRNSVTYLVADEGSTPATGSQYQLWLADLHTNPLAAPRAVAQSIAQRTEDFYGTGIDINQSVVETAKLIDVATAVQAFGTALQANTNQAALLAAARDATQSFAQPDETLDGQLYYADYRDLTDYATQVSARVSWLAGPANAVKSAVANAVVVDYPAALRANAHGLSIFVPPPARFSAVAVPYQSLAFTQSTHWDAWLALQPQ